MRTHYPHSPEQHADALMEIEPDYADAMSMCDEFEEMQERAEQEMLYAMHAPRRMRHHW